ncbi:MAG: hypothetical protein SFW36_16375 [Leptolyngbyaceae cyanobacterium bins.59]|nr:hypothetical protein [Leptolyngbyaceae cyanobacterium bins.59]
MKKRLGTWMVAGAIVTGAVLSRTSLPAKAQVRIIIQSPFPTPQRLYIPGTVGPVAPVAPLLRANEPPFIPVAVPRPYYYGSGYPTTIYNSTLVNPTVINSNVVNSTLINPTVINSPVINSSYGTAYPGTQVVVTNGLTSEGVALLQAHNLNRSYRTYTETVNGMNTFYVQVDRQPWTLLGSAAKFQLVQGIGTIYAPQGYSVLIESSERTPLGKYICYAPGACATQVLF